MLILHALVYFILISYFHSSPSLNLKSQKHAPYNIIIDSKSMTYVCASELVWMQAWMVHQFNSSTCSDIIYYMTV